MEYNNLIQFVNNGIKTADFKEIQDALIKRFREIYGDDIDLSEVTADGQLLKTIAYILKNSFDIDSKAYQSLNPMEAKGIFLDYLGLFNNISRAQSTYSQADVFVKYSGTTSNYAPERIICLDKQKNLWVWENTLNIRGERETNFNSSDAYKSLKFTCEISGKIEARGNHENPPTFSSNNHGDIGVCYEDDFIVYQVNDAVVGRDEENDDDLRSRILNQNSGSGRSVFDSLFSKLQNISGIEDVEIYNNETSSAKTAQDTTSVLAHSIYIVLRYIKNGGPDDSTIAKVIYNNLTPGINTIAFTPEASNPTGASKSYNFYISQQSSFQHTVYWKKCLPVSPAFELKANLKNGYQTKATSTSTNVVIYSDETYGTVVPTELEKTIVKKIREFTNNIKITDSFRSSDLNSSLIGISSLFNVETSWIGSSGNYTYTANDTYINYDDYGIQLAYHFTNGKPDYVIITRVAPSP